MNLSSATRQSGFTVLELLVVAAIMALLGGLLLPALSRGKAQARRAQCSNHLRQLHLAMSLYVLDHEGAFPFGNLGRYWDYDFNLYIGEPLNHRLVNGAGWFGFGGVFRCPSQGTNYYGYAYNFAGIPPSALPTGLGLGGRMVPDANAAVATREEAVVSPAQMMALADAISHGYWGGLLQHPIADPATHLPSAADWCRGGVGPGAARALDASGLCGRARLSGPVRVDSPGPERRGIERVEHRPPAPPRESA